MAAASGDTVKSTEPLTACARTPSTPPMRRMGYSTKENITDHGFRATACTILDEHLGFDRAAIQAQLAHSAKDLNGRAYNRTEFVEQRRTMLQAWANYLDTLRQGNVLPLRAHSG